MRNLAAFVSTLTLLVLLGGWKSQSKGQRNQWWNFHWFWRASDLKGLFHSPLSVLPPPTPSISCPSVMLITWFWQLLTDHIPSFGKKHTMPSIWGASNLNLHHLSLLLVQLPASSPAPSGFYILWKRVGSKQTQNVAVGRFCPYLCTTRLQESEESRKQKWKAIWICGKSIVLWRCLLFFTCLFCSFADPFLEACQRRYSLLLATG